MTEAPVIRAEDLAVRFGSRTVFKNVTFEVKRGEVFVILGGSGCGKSTLLKALIGIVPLAAGRAEILGEDLESADAETRRALLRRMGVMWQSGALFGSLTLAENVELPIEEHTALPRAAREALARAKLAWLVLAMRRCACPQRYPAAWPNVPASRAPWRLIHPCCFWMNLPPGLIPSPRPGSINSYWI